MKIIVQKPKPFTPSTICVTFESIDELGALWHRLNLPIADVRKGEEAFCMNGCPPLDSIGDEGLDLWRVVNQLWEESSRDA